MARPTKYNRVEALDAATSLFWEKGYRGVSISDLIEGTGMLAGSLYSCFGNKEGIFIDCIHHYADRSAELYQSAERNKSPLKQIEALLTNMVKDSLKDDDRRGCFVVNALLEIAPQNEEIAKVLQYYVKFSENWIEQRIDEAKEVGELDPKVDSKELAACLFSIVYAIRVKARARESAQRIRRYQKMISSALLDPWRLQKAG